MRPPDSHMSGSQEIGRMLNQDALSTQRFNVTPSPWHFVCPVFHEFTFEYLAFPPTPSILPLPNEHRPGECGDVAPSLCNVEDRMECSRLSLERCGSGGSGQCHFPLVKCSQYRSAWKGLWFTHVNTYDLQSPDQILDSIWYYADQDAPVSLTGGLQL